MYVREWVVWTKMIIGILTSVGACWWSCFMPHMQKSVPYQGHPHGRDLSVKYIYWAITLKGEPPLSKNLFCSLSCDSMTSCHCINIVRLGRPLGTVPIVRTAFSKHQSTISPSTQGNLCQCARERYLYFEVKPYVSPPLGIKPLSSL